MLEENFSAVVQMVVRKIQELTDARGNFRRVGCISLQRRIDQGFALHSVSDDEATDKRDQNRK